jgi:autotransporter-associated beta strand protein
MLSTKSGSTSMRLIASLVLLAASLAGTAHAATCTWVGGGATGAWSSAANWNACGGAHPVPITGDALIFPASAVQRVTNNDIAGLDLAAIGFQGSGYEVDGLAITLRGLSVAVSAPLPGAADPVLRLAVTLGGNMDIECPGTVGVSLTGPLALGAFGLLVDANAPVALGGPLSGSGALTKSGAGTLVLSGNNASHTGQTNVNQGVLRFATSTASGSASGSTVVGAGATVELVGLTGGSEPLVMNGTAAANARLHLLGALLFWGGPITFNGDAQIDVAPNALLILTAPLGGAAGFTKTGSGTLSIVGPPSTFQGGVRVAVGDVTADTSSALGAGPVEVSIGATLYVRGSANINLPLHLLGNAAGTGALRTAGSTTWSGPILLDASTTFDVAAGDQLTLAGPVSGAAGLTKVGPGALRLDAANTYTGITTVSAGTLSVNGSTGPITVDAGARLAGDGSAAAVSLAAQATLAPRGTFNAASLSVLGSSVLDARLGLADADRVVLQGALTKVGAGVLQVAFSDRGPGDGAQADVAYVLAQYASTNLVAADLGYDYGAAGARTRLPGAFFVEPAQLEFQALSVTLFFDGFE